MKNKTVLITGGTSGIGRAAAIALVRMGANVTIVGRSAQRGKEVLATLRGAPGTAAFIHADLSSMQEVQRVAEQFSASNARLDILLLSAGVLNFKKLITSEGLESNFATNYLSKFFLVQQLLDLLRTSSPSRIVVVGGAGVNPNPKLDFDNLQSERKFSGFAATAQSQFAVDILVAQLARRLENTGVTVNTLHPGLVKTDIMRNAPLFLKPILPIMGMRAVSVEEGARAPLHLALSDEMAGVSGRYFRVLKPVTPAAITFDPQIGERLWQTSQHILAGLHLEHQPVLDGTRS